MMRTTYLVFWRRGDIHTYFSEAEARKSMLPGDRLFKIDFENGSVVTEALVK